MWCLLRLPSVVVADIYTPYITCDVDEMKASAGKTGPGGGYLPGSPGKGYI